MSVEIGQEHTLQDGRVAVIFRRYKGGDLIRARNLVGKKGGSEALAQALLASVLMVDGKSITYEEVQELDLDDLGELLGKEDPSEASNSDT